MKYEELPKHTRKQIDELKHYAQTIQSDVLDALESTESLEEFRSQIDSSMDEIMEINGNTLSIMITEGARE